MKPASLAEVALELETLKLRLVAMQADGVAPDDTARMAQEISSIRLQLKRLRFEQEAMRRAVEQIPLPG